MNTDLVHLMEEESLSPSFCVGYGVNADLGHQMEEEEICLLLFVWRMV